MKITLKTLAVLAASCVASSAAGITVSAVYDGVAETIITYTFASGCEFTPAGLDTNADGMDNFFFFNFDVAGATGIGTLNAAPPTVFNSVATGTNSIFWEDLSAAAGDIARIQTRHSDASTFAGGGNFVVTAAGDFSSIDGATLSVLSGTAAPAAVPEPTSGALLGLGALGLLARRKR